MTNQVDEEEYDCYPETESKEIEIPLRYVCFSRNLVCSGRRTVLLTQKGITIDIIKANGHDCTASSFLIELGNIKKIRLCKSNSLCRLELTDACYQELCTRVISKYQENHYASNSTDKLFHNAIWLCLQANFETYLEKYNEIRLNYRKIVVQLEEDLHEEFKQIMYKEGKSRKGFISDWPDTVNLNKNEKPSSNVEMGCAFKNSTNKRSLKCIKNSCAVSINTVKKMKREIRYVYCPTPKHSMDLSQTDINCLRERRLLNDNIINAYILHIFYQCLTIEQQESTYIFNCFFNTKLIGNEKDPNNETPEIRHARVAKWTKNVDIFSKDFIIIPVCEEQHWFLVIICFPWMAGLIDYGWLISKQKSNIPENTTEFATIDRIKRVEEIKIKKEILPNPCILIFDSINTEKRTSKVSIIRDYLKSEWEVRRSGKDGNLIFDRTTMRGFGPKVPQQPNNVDCGVYLLNYVESFFKDPVKDFNLDYFRGKLVSWFDHTNVKAKRAHIKDMILSHSTKITRDPNDDDDDKDCVTWLS